MELETAYRGVEARLARLDFGALYGGFHPFPFALYDADRAFTEGKYIGKPSEFLGNTSVRYEGRQIAIWNLTQAEEDLDVLSSKLAHEMLHAFQHDMEEKRWADERAALVRYRYDADSFSVKLEEAACMKTCLENDAPEAFERLLSLRKARAACFPFEYDYEARIEQIEGTANYVELAALERLAPEKAARRRERMFSELIDPASYFPVRPITYLSGAAFLMCLKKYAAFDEAARPAVPFAVAATEGAKACELPGTDARVKDCLGSWLERLSDEVQKAKGKGDVALKGKMRLVAWNVYDAVRYGEYALLNNFIGYIEGDELPDTDEELFRSMKLLYGDFAAELDANLCMTRVFRR